MEHSKDLLREGMKTINGFVIEISSDLDYEEIVANILYKEETIAILSQENGLENLEIEIFPSVEAKPWKFSLDDFIKTLQLSKKCLIDMHKLSEE